MKPTLLLLAAGMGSRYGGLKQLDGLGPNGETIMDYSIYDAIKAGFGKIVFVIRKDFEQDFREKILSKYEGHVPVELCFQSLDSLPEGFTCPADRVKPWGTNHAVMMAKDVINEPFCVINCDDFYNRDAFMVIGKFLSELPEGATNNYERVFSPADLGFVPATPEELVGGANEDEAAEIFDAVLENRALPAQKNVVLANAAFGIQVMEKGRKSIEECVEIARESIDSGKALATFRKFAEINS